MSKLLSSEAAPGPVREDGQSASRPDRRALLAAGVTVVLWASAFVAIRGAGRDFSPGALALGRLLSGAAVLGLIVLSRRAGWPPRAAWPGIVAIGLLWFGVYMVALNWGEQHVDAGTAAMVVNIGPILIALLSGWLLKEGMSRPLIMGITVSFAGVILVGIATSAGGHASLAGVLLCLLAAVYLGVFPTAVAFTTWAYALSRTPASKMGATTYLVPALTVLMSWAILGQVPGLLALAGGMLCLVGVALSRRPSGAPRRGGVSLLRTAGRNR